MQTQTTIGANRPPTKSLSYISSVRRTLKRPQFWFGLVVIAPLLVWYAVFGFWPIIQAFRMAVTDYNLLDPATSPFVGLKHFRALFEYALFWTSLKNTMIYAIVLYVVMIPLAMAISVCLAALRVGRNVYQSLIFLPVVVSLVAISLLFKMLMDPQVGQFNAILRAVGLPPSRFLSGPESALLSVIMVDVWKAMGFYIIIMTAGLLNIPEEMYDAAKVDGASAWHRFRHISVPLLAHTLVLVCVLVAMHGLQVFTQVVIMPSDPGGPGRATYMMNLLVYTEAFTNLRFGFATAVAFVLFLFTLVITMVQLRLIRPNWSY